MRLPKQLLNEKTFDKPKCYLCETDKSIICQLETINLKASLKFNSMSEITFEVPRVYTDITTGETKINIFYDKIEALRLLYVQGFGYFEIQGPELTGNGIEEKKSITAYSLEYVLSQKYLDNFLVNMGTVDSLEVLNASNPNKITPITLYNQSNHKLSLLHLVLEKDYGGWRIGHVDSQLKTLSRQFEIDRESIYDFLINEVCEKFNCYIVFDTINNTINLYAESPTAKFIGDGTTSVFTIGDGTTTQPFSRIETVSVDGYKTTRWNYSFADDIGVLVLEDVPSSGAIVEAVGVDSTWDTDVFVTFDNLAQEISVNYNADEIKTVLTVTYGDDYDIREVNLGLPYLTDLSYYYTVDWMGQDLYDAYTAYINKSNNLQSKYTNTSKEILKLNDQIYYEENRLSLEYSLVSVDSSTVGTYYTRSTSSSGEYYYTEVSLPGEYKVDTKYYSNASTNVNEDKISDLYTALKNYFYAYFNGKPEGMNEALDELKALSDVFAFMETYTIDYLYDVLKSDNPVSSKETAIYNFLGEAWVEIGRTPLKTLYLASYKGVQETNIEAGWSKKDNENYGYYYPVVLLINSIESAIAKLDKVISNYEQQKTVFQNLNSDISNDLLMDNNFTSAQLIRLNAFLREDELHLDDIVETSLDNLSSSFKIKQDAMESGRIELKKLCQPQLQFSMSMANIYALPEFEPIIDQFQLGKIIKVGIRPDYIKQSRLLQVDINFDDFSDFSCEFGELTNLRTQSDIHADLLSQAISAGKNVASQSSYWTRGSDTATATDLKIQQGLLDSLTQIKSMDGTQGVVIDKYGILCQKFNADGSVAPHQMRIVNNVLLLTDDNWRTSRAGLGEFTVDGLGTFYGVCCEEAKIEFIEGVQLC